MSCKMSPYYRHLRVVLKHKYYVFKACLHSGMIWRGLVHDMSKLSLVEFFTSARHFQGSKSPVEEEKRDNGYSVAWMHHKAKNKHHWQYWLDNKGSTIVPVPMPEKYIAEMLCDWYDAAIAYGNGDGFHSTQEWYKKKESTMLLSESTKTLIRWILSAYSEEEFYRRINEVYRTKVA